MEMERRGGHREFDKGNGNLESASGYCATAACPSVNRHDSMKKKIAQGKTSVAAWILHCTGNRLDFPTNRLAIY